MPRSPMAMARIAPHLTPKVVEQFWGRVDQRGPDDCWPWMGHTNQHGYGKLYLPGLRHPPVTATRVAYYLANNSIDDAKYICHACDNRVCCNPKHLWLGTHRQNLQDMWRKGRGVTWNKGMKFGPRKVAA